MTNAKQLLASLIEAVQLLAAEYETQVSHFPTFVHIPDELAITYSESLLLLDQLVVAGFIDQQQQTKFLRIDCYLEEMSDAEEYWTLHALQKAPRWQQIRLMAQDLLLLFNQDVREPDLSWIKYAQGHVPNGSDMVSVNGHMRNLETQAYVMAGSV